MDIRMNAALIKKLRDERAWSQEHLASVAGVSLRTIQRVESEGRASVETRMALAAAFNIDVAQLATEEIATQAIMPKQEARLSWQHYRQLRFLLIIAGLLGLDFYQHGKLGWSLWALWIMMLVMTLRYVKHRFVAPKSS